jgi:hypothetical protein
MGGEFTVLIIPSTLQSGRDGIGFVLGNKTSTRSRRPRTAAISTGIKPLCITKSNIRCHIIQHENDKATNAIRLDYLFFDKKKLSEK